VKIRLFRTIRVYEIHVVIHVFGYEGAQVKVKVANDQNGDLFMPKLVINKLFITDMNNLSNMQSKSLKVELPEDLFQKIGSVASEHFETTREYIEKVVSESLREELELKEIKRQIASKYASDEISYESLKSLLGYKEAERVRIYKETILESLLEADAVAKRLKE
jgi:hypothetical protein